MTKCDLCGKKATDQCDICKANICEDCAVMFDQLICWECFKENYFICAVCGTIFDIDDAIQCEICESAVCSRCAFVCNKCQALVCQNCGVNNTCKHCLKVDENIPIRDLL